MGDAFKEPENLQQIVALGNASLVKRDFVGAIAYFSVAIQMDPNNSRLYRQRASVHFKNSDAQAALADLGTAIALSPDDPDAYFLRGRVHQLLQDESKAIADFGAALQLNPGHQMAAEFLRSIGGDVTLASKQNTGARPEAKSIDSSQKKAPFYREFWPSIRTPEDAVSATNSGVFASGYSAFLDLITLGSVALYNRTFFGPVASEDKATEIFGQTVALLVDLFLAWRLKSRPERVLAAGVILVFAVLSAVAVVSTRRSGFLIFVSIWLVGAALNGFRGAYFLRRLHPKKPLSQNSKRRGEAALTTVGAGFVAGLLAFYDGHSGELPPAVILGEALAFGLASGGIIWICVRNRSVSVVRWISASIVLVAVIYRVFFFQPLPMPSVGVSGHGNSAVSKALAPSSEDVGKLVCSNKPAQVSAWEGSSIGRYFSGVRGYIDNAREKVGEFRASNLDEAKAVQLVSRCIDELEDIVYSKHLYFIDSTIDGIKSDAGSSQGVVRCSASVTMDAVNILVDLKELRYAIAVYAKKNEGVVDIAAVLVDALSDSSELLSRMAAVAAMPQPRKPFRLTYDVFLDGSNKPLVKVVREQDAQLR